MNSWTNFKRRILINKPVESIYKCWATKSQIETWFLEKADYQSGETNRKPDELIQKGDKYTWKWHNWDFTEEGQILEANGKDLLSFTFGKAGNVHIHLKEVGDFTEVTLIQDAIPTDDKSKMMFSVGCSNGWTFWMANLKAYLEHGITLHAKGMKQSEVADFVNA